MHPLTKTARSVLVLLVAVAGVGCADAPPTAATLATLETSLLSRATTERVEFQFLFGGAAGIGIPAPCLGGIFVISGLVTGWAQITETPNGQTHITEHWDFSQLEATLGQDTWNAAPGAGEMFSFNLPTVGSAAVRVVHNGRSRFINNGDGPDVFFVHRFNVLRLPSGEFLFTRPETEFVEIQCIGPNQ
jgi:hypothetical protein